MLLQAIKMDLLLLLLSFLNVLTMVISGNDEVSISTDNTFHSNYLSGKELKTVMILMPPFNQVFRNASGRVAGFSGVWYEEVMWLSRRLNFSVHIEVSKDNVYGAPNENGSWNGLFGQLQRGEVDFGMAAVAKTFGILDFAIYVGGAGSIMLVKYPTPQTAIDAPITIFSLNVWIGLLLSITACIGFIQFLTFLARKYLGDPKKYSDITVSNTWLFMLGTLTNHSVQSLNISRPQSTRIITTFWILTTFVFVNVYGSCIMSYMSLRFQRPVINTLQDLANNPNYLPTALKNVAPENILMSAAQGTIMRKIGDKFLQCNDRCRLVDYSGMVKNVLEENYAAFMSPYLANYFIKKTMTDDGQCRLTMAQETMGYMHLYMGAPRNSPYASELRKASFLYSQFGLLLYWTNTMIPAQSQCQLQYNDKGENVKLVNGARIKLEQFYVAFIVLFVGYGLALLQFLRERFITPLKK